MNKHTHRLVYSRSRGFCVAVAETATAAGKSASGEARRTARGVRLGLLLAAMGSPALAQVTAPPAGAAAAALVRALPTGGVIKRGSATIGSDGTELTVNQSSQRLVADWQSFSIGSSNTVRFVQPDSSSVALNRVVGDDPSQIFGSLIANGHVYLQNANGVLFGQGAQVSVGGLMATTLRIDTDDFMSGGTLHLLPGGASDAQVVNAGSIVTAPGGSVLLAAPIVANSGSITTPRGTTALVAAAALDVDPTGSGLLSINVSAAAVNARLSQTGRISADGGSVQLAAAATDAALRTVMQVDGIIQARSIEERGGQIVLSGGSSGTVTVGGTLDASGGAAGATGGTIKVLGDSVALGGSARLDASGASGGTILVGGNRHGDGPEQNATTTIVAAGATLDASAGRSGDGGNVVVWADGVTSYAGSISATGGTQHGDGGQVEVSGKSLLDFTGSVDLRAPKGKAGTLLLDPTNLDVGYVADKNGDGTTGDDVTSTGVGQYDPGTNSKITAAQVASLLASANLSLAASNSLTVSAPINVASNGANSTLTLGAHTVSINAPMTLNNTSLSIYKNCDSIAININAPVQTFNSISLTGTTIDIFGAVSADTLNITTFGTVTTAGGVQTGSIAANNVTIYGQSNGVVNFPNVKGVDGNLGNQIGNLQLNYVRLANVRVDNDPGTTLNVSGNLGELNLISASGVATSDFCEGPCLSVTGNFSLRTLDPDPSTGAAVINASIGGRFSFNTASDLTVNANGDLHAAGIANGNLYLSTTGLFTMVGDITGNGSNGIEIHGNGFNNADNYNLSAPNGNFFVFSNDYTQDDLGTRLTFSGSGTDSTFNFKVFDINGQEISDPSNFRGYGNGFFTNQTGSFNIDSVGSISRTYDATTFLNVNVPVSGTATVGNSTLPDSIVSVYAQNGQFNTKVVGTGKGYTLPADENSIAYGQSGTAYFNLNSSGFVRPEGPARGNYGDSEVTPYQIGIDGLAASNKVYDTTRTATLTGSASVSPLDEDNVVLNGVGTGTFADKNVGTAKPITVTGYTLSGYDASNYVLVQPTLFADITPALLALTGIAASNKTYDTTTVATLTGTARVAPLSGDTVGVTGTGSGAFADKNVGSAKPVTVTGYLLTGTDAGNYTLVEPASLTASITPALLGIGGIGAADKVYDTTTRATLTGTATVTPLGNDAVGVGGTGSGTFGDKNVGTRKAVTVTGYTLTGADAGNYQVVEPTGVTASITQALLAIGGISAASKIYNANTVAALTGSASVTPLSGDVVGVGGTGVGAFADKNVGTSKAVTVAGYTLTGRDAGNYQVIEPSGLLASITPAALAVTGIGAANKVYDATTGATLTGTATATPLAGDSVVVGGTGSGTFANKNVGTGKAVTVVGYTLSGRDAGNYAVVEPTGVVASITPASLVVSGVSAANKVYDATTRAAISGTAVVSPIGNDVVAVTGTASGAFVDKNAGVAKAVTVTGYTLTGTDAGNYQVVAPVGLVATITPAALAVTGIGAANKVYDATTGATLTGTASATPIAGDSVSVGGTGSGTFANKNVGTGKAVTVVGYTLSGRDAGNYTVVEPTGVVASITPASLAIGGVSVANKVYDGTTQATISGTAVVAPIGNDQVSVSGSGTALFVDKNAGTGKAVTLSGFTLTGADAGNYLAVAPSGLRADIAKLVLMPVGIRASSRVESSSTTVALDTSQASVPGIVTGDNVVLVTGGAIGVLSSPGAGVNKPVTVTGLTLGGTDANNYSVISPTGINAVTVTIVTAATQIFLQLRYQEYLQALADAQEPFRRAIAESLASGFGKENIRKQLARGLVFETGFAPPAVDDIQPPKPPDTCPASAAPGTLGCR